MKSSAGPVDNLSSSSTKWEVNRKTTINLFGVGDGHEELGAKLARFQSNVNADLVRNLQNASVG